jgi:hypothetical protein
MRIYRSRAASGLVALAALALVAGCASATPAAPSAEPSGASTPAATATSAPVDIATLRFSGASVEALDADGETVSAESFAAGTDAIVAIVSEASGAEPTVTDNEEQCAAANRSYAWPGLVLTAWADSSDFALSFDAATSGDVRLEVSGGFAPGDDVSSFVASQPEENLGRTSGADLFIAFDVISRVQSGDYVSPVGAVGYAPDGATLQSVITPGEWSSFLC